jgi:ketosteroid isomerase-like protein
MTDRTEQARATIEAFSRRDVETVVESFARDGEWWPLRSATEGPYRGHDGMREWFADTAEQFAYMRATVHDVRAHGDAAVAFGQLQVKGRQSGAPIDLPIAWVFRFAGDKVVWAKSYTDQDEALAEAGLPDEA